MFFFFNDTATTEIYTLSLHDALPIFRASVPSCLSRNPVTRKEIAMPDPIIPTPQDSRLLIQDTTTKTAAYNTPGLDLGDRKSTRLNSSHANISYAVFCLKKKKTKTSKVIYFSPALCISIMPGTRIYRGTDQ